MERELVESSSENGKLFWKEMNKVIKGKYNTSHIIKDDKKKELKNKEELRDRKNKYFGGTLNVRGVDKEDLQLNVAERLEVKRMNVRLLVGKRLRVNFERWKVGK